MSANEVPARDRIDPRFTWNRESLYPSPGAWRAAFDHAQSAVAAFAETHRGFAENAGALLSALEAAFKLVNQVEQVLLYAGLELSVDTTNDEASSMNSEARSLYAEAQSATSFLEPGVLELGQAAVRAWMAEEPGLMIYEHYLENLFRKAKHIRSAEVEGLLGMLSDPFAGIGATISMLTNADMDFGRVADSAGVEYALTQGSYSTLITHPDRELRRSTWERYHDRYLEHKHALASGLETSTKQAAFIARVRGHGSTLEAALHPHNLPTEVFHNLLAVFVEQLPHWHRYFSLRKRLLGVDQLRPYDVWAPLTKNPPRVPYEQAVEWISAGLAPLGEAYVKTLRRGVLKERWVDVYPNQGKRQGAFSWGTAGTHPFIVMNYNDSLFSLSTLAHELGHSMHSYLCWETQPLVYSDYSLFVAEVASNLHQALVRAYLFATQPDPDFQIALIEEAMSNFHRYLLLMPTLARFEWQMHQGVSEGRGLTSSVLIERMADLLQEAYGEEMEIDHPRSGMTWATFGHLYVYFYVFQYATGIAAAQVLANRLVAGEPGASEAYLEFLRCGGSLHPLDALGLAGVDLRSPEAITAAYQVIGELTDRLEALTS